jgi:hypothetical protein
MSFKSFLQAVGRDFKKGLDFALPISEGVGQVAVSVFAPALGPMFHSTVMAVALAEQSAAAVGKQDGSGQQKAAAVIQLIGPLIKTGLADAGRPNDDAAIQKYLDAVVMVLNSAPAQIAAAAPADPTRAVLIPPAK